MREVTMPLIAAPAPARAEAWRRRATWIALLVALSMPGGALAQESAREAERPPAAPRSDAHEEAGPRAAGDGRRTLARLPANLFRATLGVFSRDNAMPALAGGAATAVGAALDDEIARALAAPDNGFGQSLETGGQPLWTGGLVTVLFVAGRLSHGTRFRAASYDWLDATLVTAGYTTVLKELVGRERPNGEDDKSFPSGHTASAFTMAAVAERHYGWKVGVPVYALATAVAVSRLQRAKHYLTDVMAGATLGYIVGRTVVRVNGGNASPGRSTTVSVAPVLARRTRALTVSISF